MKADPKRHWWQEEEEQLLHVVCSALNPPRASGIGRTRCVPSQFEGIQRDDPRTKQLAGTPASSPPPWPASHISAAYLAPAWPWSTPGSRRWPGTRLRPDAAKPCPCRQVPLCASRGSLWSLLALAASDAAEESSGMSLGRRRSPPPPASSPQPSIPASLT